MFKNLAKTECKFFWRDLLLVLQSVSLIVEINSMIFKNNWGLESWTNIQENLTTSDTLMLDWTRTKTAVEGL